jgi:hypothetical protein
MSFDFLIFRKEHRFIKHLSIAKRCLLAKLSIPFPKHTISLIPSKISDIFRTSEGRGPGGQRGRGRPYADRPRTRPGLFFSRCAMVETPAVRRKAPVSAAANPHNVLANYNQPTS